MTRKEIVDKCSALGYFLSKELTGYIEFKKGSDNPERIKISKSNGEKVIPVDSDYYEVGQKVTIQGGLLANIINIYDNVITVKLIEGKPNYDTLVVCKSKGLEVISKQ